eukprot:8260221-Pyramimonas_sp.AAC.2
MVRNVPPSKGDTRRRPEQAPVAFNGRSFLLRKTEEYKAELPDGPAPGIIVAKLRRLHGRARRERSGREGEGQMDGRHEDG